MDRNPDITLRQLRALAAVARHGTLSAAAEVLLVTAPAVSIQLKTLEDHVGAPLFDRNHGQLRLTPVGAELLSLAEKLEASLSLSMRRVSALRAGAAGLVNVGVVSTGKYFAPSIVAAFRAQYPQVVVQLQIGNRAVTRTALAQGVLDMAIMGRPPEGLSVEIDELGDHPHILIAGRQHPLVGREVTPAALMRETFLAREEGSGTRILTMRFLDMLTEGRPVSMVEMNSNESIKQAVIAGLGVALLSAHTVEAELRDGRLVMLPAAGLPIIRKWLLVRPSEPALSGAAALFRDFVLAQQGRFLPRLP